MTPRWQQLLWGRHPGRTALRAVLLAAGCWLLLRFVCLPVRVEGISMLPTIRDGSWHLANLLQYRWREPRRGELVIIRLAGHRAFYLKRVLARPGERIAFVRGQLRVDGRATAEPYLREQGDWNLPDVTLAPDEYFVAGDHRALPLAEHKAGAVRRGDIRGGLLR
ncbi:MAG: signal peptidase I [Kiritimatiellaeota bacterium]|nr:signal peptidase I [Kiritimatiellota bacterium]